MKTYSIENDFQKIEFLSLGATIYKWTINELNRNIVLTNDDKNDYLNPECGYFGATIGRITNRIKNGIIKIDDVAYQLPRNFANGKHTLHGGPEGFFKKEFEVTEHTLNSITFKYLSRDMEEGFPGNVTLIVKYEINYNKMIASYNAFSDKKTPLNITNHTYFNLGGSTILDHTLYVDADKYVEIDNESIPTGALLSTAGTPLDFSKPTLLGKNMESAFLQRPNTLGIDFNLLFHGNKGIVLESNDLLLSVKTSYPSVQLFTTNFKLNHKLLGGIPIRKYAGICLECQYPTDSLTQGFMDILLKPGDVSSEHVKYELSIKK